MTTPLWKTGRILLISNSTQFGHGYLDHCEEAITAMVDKPATVAFIPYALKDVDGYAAKAKERFEAMGYRCVSVHEATDPKTVIAEADAIFTGGGNTFRLLKTLQELGLLEAIREAVARGCVYMGASAGSNVGGQTMQTTNDMPIVWPPVPDALKLVPFNINPHYLDAVPGSTHMGETRETRLKEFHEEQTVPVLAIREGAMLAIRDGEITLLGKRGGRLFLRDEATRELAPEEKIEGIPGW